MIAAGLLLIIGLVCYFFGDALHWVGRLPGDIRIERPAFNLYIPITTMLIFSLAISLIMRLVRYLLH